MKKNKKNDNPEPGESLIDALINQEDQSYITDLLEVGIDAIMDDGLYKEIPILSTVIGIAKAGLGIRNYLFVKKLIQFISDYNSVSNSFKINLKKKLEEDDLNFKKKLGDHLIFAIESFNQNDKINALAKILNAYVIGKISQYEFLKFSYFLDKIDWNDINYLRSFYIFHSDAASTVGQRDFLSNELKLEWNNEVIQSFAYIGLITFDLGEYHPEPIYSNILVGGGKRSRSGSYKTNEIGEKFLEIIDLLEIEKLIVEYDEFIKKT